MKKLLAILPLLIVSCQKDVAASNLKSDSVMLSKQSDIAPKIDSAPTGLVTVDKMDALEKDRVIEGEEIIKTIDASQLPITIADEFSDADQQMIIKIKNFKTDKISGIITPENPEMNIRFNQIKLTNGDYDGPFGSNLTYDIKSEGEIWLIIAKSNMASGETKGKFSVRLE